MTERIHVMVTVDTDELREWADRHADMGNHGVAHVLYQAAREGESLGEQAIREAKRDALREIKAELERMLDGFPQHGRNTRARWATEWIGVVLDRADHLADGGES